jgi:TorA maturation chaperone TorD
MALARAKWYSLAGTLLSAPASEAVIDELFSWECRESLAEWVTEGSLASIDRLAADLPDLGILREAYDDLFNVPGSQYLTPYESVFRDSRMLDDGREVGRLTFGPSTDDVIRYYHLAGLEISDKYDDLPDHVALEIVFMRFLCEREAEAFVAENRALAARIRETEEGFLERHLTAWLPDLLAKARERMAHPFYICLLTLVRDFTLSDMKYLKELN